MREIVGRSAKKAALTGTVALAALMAVATLGNFENNTSSAVAQNAAVVAPAAGPGSFANIVEAVSPAVVSVRVRQDISLSSDRPGRPGPGRQFGGDPRGFEDLPENHPFNRFFRRFEREFGQESRPAPRPGPRSPRRFGSGQGSGFIISNDGYVVTNEHVIEDASSITVVVNNSEEYEARLIGADKRTDLALLKIEDGGDDFEFVKFADTDTVRVGDWVVTMGNPFGLGGTVTAGIVSARGREIGSGPYDDFLQIDAAVNRGNSGGPTFDLNGQVIGVNTAIFSPNGGNVGIAFAIPASIAKEVIEDLRDDGSVTRGWLGVSIQPVTGDIADSLGLAGATGALVTQVAPDSPAEDAGIELGDAILEVNGEAIDDPRDLARTIAAIDPRSNADVLIWRDGRERVVSVRIGQLANQVASLGNEPDQLPEPEQDLGAAVADLGLSLALTPDGEGGVLVTEVDRGSQAGEKGLRRGDRILQVANDDVATAADVAEAVEAARDAGRRSVLFLVESRNRVRFVAMTLDRS